MKATVTIGEYRVPTSPFKLVKNKERGYFHYFLADKEVVVCEWNDNSVGTVASNTLTIFPINEVKPFSQSEKIHIGRSTENHKILQRKYGRRESL